MTSNPGTFSIQTGRTNDVRDLLDPSIRFLKNSKGVAYANCPAAFDIEVSSFYRRKDDHSIQCQAPTDPTEWEKVGVMYCFVFGINGKAYIGRTWEDALNCFKAVSDFYSLGENKRMIFYVHNLSYEFQFIRKRFAWISVFSLSERDPVKATSAIGVEFRCSYHLSGYSLATVGKNLSKYKVEKKVGDLDYSLIRSPDTPMTETELGYVLNDGLVVMAYIQERIEQDGNILRIPLTKTGYVRKYCRKECLYGGKGDHKLSGRIYGKYHRIMTGMTIKSEQEYRQMKRGFQGGFTHADALYTGLTMEDVTSYDFTSSYPYCMVAYQYPMSSGRLVHLTSTKEFIKYLTKYCCLFDVTFLNVRSTFPYEHPISSSKCLIEGHRLFDNGRVVEAERLSITITEQDFFVYRRFYTWDKMLVRNFRVYMKGYLPTAFVHSILRLYEDKTKLKGIDDLDTHIRYMNSKEQLNSCYGMTVTDICRPEIMYKDDNWSTEVCDVKESIVKYNESKTRFLFYGWGLWTTAYARRNLFTGIYKCREDYLYSDTDSIKILHADRHEKYIRDYNDQVKTNLTRAMKFHQLPFEMVEPITNQGKKKLLGAWDYDGHYRKFKTLGAKRYMTEDDEGNHSLTVSGLDKRSAIPYLERKAKKEGCSIFDLFKDGMRIPAESSGRRTHTYIDYEEEGIMTDYMGNRCRFDEKSSLHMEESEYTLGMTSDYIDFILGLREKP